MVSGPRVSTAAPLGGEGGLEGGASERLASVPLDARFLKVFCLGETPALSPGCPETWWVSRRACSRPTSQWLLSLDLNYTALQTREGQESCEVSGTDRVQAVSLLAPRSFR